MVPNVQAFFDDVSNTISYVVSHPATNVCAVIDSVMDWGYAAGRLTHDRADEMIEYIQSNGLSKPMFMQTTLAQSITCKKNWAENRDQRTDYDRARSLRKRI